MLLWIKNRNMGEGEKQITIIFTRDPAAESSVVSLVSFKLSNARRHLEMINMNIDSFNDSDNGPHKLPANSILSVC